MTTIAYKDGVIAYDSQITRGDVITYDDYEKCIDQAGVKFFCCGTVSDYQRLVDVYFGAKPDGNIDATAIVLDGESLMMVAVDDSTGLWKSPVLRDRPYAIGSGTPYARSLRWIWAHPLRRPSRWRPGAIPAPAARFGP